VTGSLESTRGDMAKISGWTGSPFASSCSLYTFSTAYSLSALIRTLCPRDYTQNERPEMRLDFQKTAVMGKSLTRKCGLRNGGVWWGCGE
jgi:hypothetical protein